MGWAGEVVAQGRRVEGAERTQGRIKGEIYGWAGGAFEEVGEDPGRQRRGGGGRQEEIKLAEIEEVWSEGKAGRWERRKENGTHPGMLRSLSVACSMGGGLE